MTLTGPGGVGKTRLALAAAKAADQGGDAVPADLSAVSDPSHMLAVIIQALGVRPYGSAPLMSKLQRALAGRPTLLILDSFEHLLPAAPLIADLLAACPEVKLLITSRAPLRILGEQELAVPPLPVPEARPTRSPARLATCPSVALFVARARAIDPGFALTRDNAVAIGELCRRLDGLPLALELAAARTRLFSPQSLLSRVEELLSLLTDGTRDGPPRHRSLEATISWSFDLLDCATQVLFRRLAVFVAGCRLDALGWVAAASGQGPDAGLVRVTTLVEHHLLARVLDPDGEPRLRMLDTIRTYGLEQLAHQGELEDARRRHARYIATLVEQAAPALLRSDVDATLRRLDADIGNIRAALDWCLAADDSETALRIVGPLRLYWNYRGLMQEGLGWTERALALPSADRPTATRARALHTAGAFRANLGAEAEARPLFVESAAIWRDLEGSGPELAATLIWLGIVTPDLSAARTTSEEAVTLMRVAGRSPGLANALSGAGAVALRAGDSTAARAFFTEAAALFRQVGDRRQLAFVLTQLGQAALQEGDDGAAGRRFVEALALAREMDTPYFATIARVGLGSVALRQGAIAAAGRHFLENLTFDRERGPSAYTIPSLEGWAVMCVRAGRPSEAVRWLGAAAAARVTSRPAAWPALDTCRADALTAARAQLGEAAFAAAWMDGAATPLADALAAVLAGAGWSGPARLSRRELQVLHLLAAGESNRAIAGTLVIAERTVVHHVERIYQKLSVRNRADATAYALRHGLVDAAPDQRLG